MTPAQAITAITAEEEPLTPAAQAWLLLSGIEATLDEVASIPREAIDPAQIARIERQLAQFRIRRAA